MKIVDGKTSPTFGITASALIKSSQGNHVDFLVPTCLDANRRQFATFHTYCSRTGRTRTCNQGIMHTTSTFAAPFEFVVWTIPSLYVSAVWSLHLLPFGS